MGIWILIFILVGNGKASYSVEFNSLDKCMKAKQQIQDKGFSYPEDVHMYCVEK